MEKLTERFENGQVGTLGCGNNCKYNYRYCDNALENCPTIAKIFEKLADYEDAEEQGLLLRLPCKVGDAVFYINGKIILEYEVVGFSVDGTGAWLIYGEHHVDENDKTYGYNLDVDKIGKTVFLTREEAKSRLKELRGEKNESNYKEYEKK